MIIQILMMRSKMLFWETNYMIPLLLQFIIDHNNNNTVFQFEITGDILDPSIIEFLNNNAPKGLFRFEIGIQSINYETNTLVDRHQDNQKQGSNKTIAESPMPRQSLPV